MKLSLPTTEEEALETIVWSADNLTPDEIVETASAMKGLRYAKIDRLHVRKYGDVIVPLLESIGVKVFNDAKIVEIPEKIWNPKYEALTEVELRTRPWMLNCMAGCQSNDVLEHDDPNQIDGLKRFADACNFVGTRPCGVTVLTSKTSQVVDGEFHGRRPVEQVLYYVDRLLECGFTDVVCSPEEVAAIRMVSRFNGLDLNTPGIRPAGSEVGDQARVNTPRAALQAGSTRLVIGRPLTNGDPAENLRNIVAEILSET
jgi:orotidine-5'-phosphate decarboxylase